MDEKKLIELLMLRRHRMPGLTEEELISEFGKDYEKLIADAGGSLEPLGLEIRSVEQRGIKRYFIAFREITKKSNVPRIDALAAMVACVAYISAKKENVRREELEGLLREKFSKRSLEIYLSQAIRDGYLSEEEGYYGVGWRALAEIDLKELNRILTG
jgi:hypothetical protein